MMNCQENGRANYHVMDRQVSLRKWKSGFTCNGQTSKSIESEKAVLYVMNRQVRMK